ncbi:hypothetical protein [Marivita hallyeonensis]|uniref:Uncharacterized protein n=1 Tax=Marivita hallyeonensis TaxID=996342 RepID=A0A1M5XU78_9RHOB|nr:hypothetical protein [Marivita hallyeonensis]SHI03282.1 hypothetical protein SAMN05443551_4145 [Marivita hallyeonensis]
MEMVADILLVAGALGAGLYCFILSRRLTRFTDLENGVGAAVAVLSGQVTDLQTALDSARNTAAHSTDTLEALTSRAEDSAKRLELMVAALHDLPPQTEAQRAPEPIAEPVFARHAGGSR